MSIQQSSQNSKPAGARLLRDKVANMLVSDALFGFLFVVAMWYSVFGSSIILRPYDRAVWLVVVFWGVLVCRKQLFLVKLNLEILLFLLMLVVVIFSATYSLTRQTTLFYSLKLFLYFVVAFCIASRKELSHRVITVMLIFLTVHLIATLSQIFFPTFYEKIFPPLLAGAGTDENITAVEGFRSRGTAVGFTLQPATNAFLLSVGFSISYVRIFTAKKRSSRVWYSIYSLAFFIGVFLTKKRSFSIFVVVGSVLIMAYFVRRNQYRKNPFRFLGLFLVLLLIFAVLVNVVPQMDSIREKFTDTSESGDVTNGRLDIISEALQREEFNRFLGTGFASFQTVYGDASSAHNVYLQLYLELGLLGAAAVLLPFLIAIIITGGFLFQKEKRSPEDTEVLVLSFWQQCVFFVYGLVGAPLYSELIVFFTFYFILAVLVGIRQTKAIPLSGKKKASLPSVRKENNGAN